MLNIIKFKILCLIFNIPQIISIVANLPLIKLLDLKKYIYTELCNKFLFVQIIFFILCST